MLSLLLKQPCQKNVAYDKTVKIFLFTDFVLSKFSCGSVKNFFFAFGIELFIVCHVVPQWIFSAKNSMKLQLLEKCVFITPHNFLRLAKT